MIRGWHWHRRQTDVIIVIKGRALLPLYDGRESSPTFRAIEEHVGNGDEPFALFVPTGVYHGYKTLDTEAALILNFPDQLYDPAAPDEERIPHDSPDVPYDWSART